MSKISLGGFKKKFSGLKFPASISRFSSKLKKSPKKSPKILIGILLLIVVVLFTLQQIYTNKLNEQIDSSGEHSPSATPCIAKVLPGGKQIYTYSHGKNVLGPKLQIVTIDPLDPQKGQKITLTAEIKYDSPVTNATVFLVTDNKTVEEKMRLISGEPNNGTWATEIEVNDTYLCTYELNFDLQSQTDNYKGGMVFRP